jgi:hypothetical protein
VIRGCALALASLLLAFTARALPPINVTAPPEYRRIAEKIRTVPAEQIRVIASLTGVEESNAPIEVAIARTDSSLAKEVAPWAAGYAISRAGVVVLIPARTTSYPDDTLEETYLHELAHVFISRAAGGAEVPRWFNEGLAVVAGKSWTLEDRTRLAWESIVSRDTVGDEIDPLFLSDERSARRAYAMSEAFMRDLLRRYGARTPAEILARMRAGEPFERAFFLVTGRTPERAWNVFWKSQGLANVSIPILASSAALWLAITLIAIAAIFRKRKVNQLQLRIWELEEEIERLKSERSESEGTVN